MYLSAAAKPKKFFDVPRDYEQWSLYEQMNEWDKRAAQAADAFRFAVRAVDRLPEGAAKQEFKARIGQRSNPRSAIFLYDWIWHRAKQPNLHVWNNPNAQDRVQLLEKLTASIKSDMKAKGLGDMAWTGKVSPWVWIGIGGAGVLGLGYMLFAKRGR